MRWIKKGKKIIRKKIMLTHSMFFTRFAIIKICPIFFLKHDGYRNLSDRTSLSAN